MCQRELGRVQKWIDPGSNEKMPFGQHLGMFSSMFWTGLQMAQKWIDPGSDQKMSFGEHLGVFSSMVWARQAAKQARQAKAGRVPVSA